MAVDIVNSIFDCRTWVSAFIALATSRSLAANNFTVIQLFLLYLAGTLSVVRRALRVFSLGLISGWCVFAVTGASPIAFYSLQTL